MNTGLLTRLAKFSPSILGLFVKNDSTKGSALVGHNTGTVRDALESNATSISHLTDDVTTVKEDAGVLKTQVTNLGDTVDDLTANLDTLGNDSSTSISSLNQVVDMHFGVLRGTGYTSSDLGNLVLANTISAVSAGKILPIGNTDNFFVGQLIAYLAGNGEWYSAVIQSKDASSLALASAIEAPIPLGSVVSNFYSDVSHPNVNGFKAIADFALRTLNKKYEVVTTWRSTDGYATQGTVTVNQIVNVTYKNPGSSEFPGIGITSGSVLAGFVSPAYDMAAGNYIARVTLNPTLSGSSNPATPATLAIRETVGVSATTISSVQANGDSPTVVDVPFHKRPNSTFQVLVTSPVVGHQFAVVKIEILRVISNVSTLNKGVHVCLGDSWFVNPGFVARLQERLPNATIINKGVGGNRADQLWDRFDTDVTPYAPDYVWAMAGTNDVAQNYAVETYAYNMGIVSSKISRIGAEGIIFNCSVGAATHPTLGNLLTPSRRYAIQVVLHSEASDRKAGGFANTKVHLQFALNIPANSTRRVAMFPGSTTRPATIEKLYGIGQTGTVTGNIRFGYSTSAGATITEDLQTVALATTVRSNLVVTKATTNDRFLLIEVENTASTALDVIGFALATWAPS